MFGQFVSILFLFISCVFSFLHLAFLVRSSSKHFPFSCVFVSFLRLRFAFNDTNLILVHITIIIMNLGECILHNAIPLSMGVFTADTRCHSDRVCREETLSASVLRENRALLLVHHRLRRDPCTRHAHQCSMPSTELLTERAYVSVLC